VIFVDRIQVAARQPVHVRDARGHADQREVLLKAEVLQMSAVDLADVPRRIGPAVGQVHAGYSPEFAVNHAWPTCGDVVVVNPPAPVRQVVPVFVGKGIKDQNHTPTGVGREPSQSAISPSSFSQRRLDFCFL